jgi:hypothetical protein
LLHKVQISGSTGAVLIGHRWQDERASVCFTPSGTLTVINLPRDTQHMLQLLQVGRRTDRILLTIWKLYTRYLAYRMLAFLYGFVLCLRKSKTANSLTVQESIHVESSQVHTTSIQIERTYILR